MSTQHSWQQLVLAMRANNYSFDGVVGRLTSDGVDVTRSTLRRLGKEASSDSRVARFLAPARLSQRLPGRLGTDSSSAATSERPGRSLGSAKGPKK